MKYKIILSIVFLVSVLTACKIGKKTAYEFPPAINKDPKAKAQLITYCDKGKILYSINCAKCHNKVIKGKEIIPDFPANKLEGYKLAILNPQHDSSMRSTRVGPADLIMISDFLLYKKKNPVAKTGNNSAKTKKLP